MKPIDVQSNTYIAFDVESNKNNSKFRVGDDVRIRKFKNIFAKCCTPSSEEVLFIKKVKNTVPWTYIISDRNISNCWTLLEKRIAKTKSEFLQLKR